MAQATAVLLLDEARWRRERAVRARRLAGSVVTVDVVENLTRYADELERTATELEERASALAETVAKTHALSREVRALIGEARAQLHNLRHIKPER